ncbi:ATP-binding protein [Flavobacterium sp. SUN052]|uniref:sensor histidine kinase n=1 Tax=Flavobacterium sp. SUN052 TaxID=3002441 RepID=UPI00237D40C2|nr:ATP-binding protein [Flavobacterium sp. SUN052]MEC4005233.1 ATP-binding protein [Flavobacterium sp. SUN052]
MSKKVIPENIKIALQIEDNENSDAKLIIANKELAFQNQEKEKRAQELVIANEELAFQNQEKEKRAQELVIANKELEFQNQEKEKRAQELAIANEELLYQNQEKEKRAQELVIANEELAFQNQEKEKRAQELVIANKELLYQNQEKEKRAQELIIANKELLYQNQEKENRAQELVIANEELAFQNQEKEKRAQELVIANKELEFQNQEKEKRAQELAIANKEIETFTYISSHDLQEPLRKIQTFSSRIFVEEYDNLSAMGKYYVERTKLSALHMQTLINDLLAYSRTKTIQRKFVNSNLNKIAKEAIKMLKEEIHEKQAKIEVNLEHKADVIPFQFRQLLQNLISNSLKYSIDELKPHIVIKSDFVKYDKKSSEKFILKCDYCHISVSDNGIGFDPQFKHKIFEIFQRLHHKNDYKGTGIGLTIARKIVENHNGIIAANGEINKGAQFDIYIPTVQIQ